MFTTCHAWLKPSASSEVLALTISVILTIVLQKFKSFSLMMPTLGRYYAVPFPSSLFDDLLAGLQQQGLMLLAARTATQHYLNPLGLQAFLTTVTGMGYRESQDIANMLVTMQQTIRNSGAVRPSESHTQDHVVLIVRAFQLGTHIIVQIEATFLEFGLAIQLQVQAQNQND